MRWVSSTAEGCEAARVRSRSRTGVRHAAAGPHWAALSSERIFCWNVAGSFTSQMGDKWFVRKPGKQAEEWNFVARLLASLTLHPAILLDSAAFSASHLTPSRPCVLAVNIFEFAPSRVPV